MLRCCVLGLMSSLCVLVATAAVQAADPGTGVLLRYHHGEGDHAVYDTVAVSHEIRIPGGSSTDMRMTSYSLHGQYGVTFRGLSDDGLGRGEITDGQLAGVMEDGSMALAATLSLPPDEDDEEVDTYSLRGELPRDTASGGHSTADVFFLSGVGVLPEHPVTVGDSWEDVVQFPQWADDAHQKSMWRFHSQIVGTESYGGRECFKIRTTLSLEEVHDSSIERINGIYAADWLFDPGLGLIMNAEMSGAVNVVYDSGLSATFTYHNSVNLTEYNGEKLTTQ